MHSKIDSPSAFDQLAHAVHDTVQNHFALKFDHLRHGLCAAIGFKSHAALLAALKDGNSVDTRNFNHLALMDRLQSMGVSQATAEATSSIIDGRRLVVNLQKQPPNPQYSNSSYILDVKARDHQQRSVTERFFFIMPLFGKENDPPYQVDSASFYRHSSEFSVSRHPNVSGLLTVEGFDGQWGGGLYVYDIQSQQDDRNCKQLVSAALARKILPAISPRFNCQLYKPDGYDDGAWKLRVSLGDVAKKLLKNHRLVVQIPALEKRNVFPDKGYRFDVDKMEFKEGLLEAHIYTNGISEDENPTPISEVRAEIMRIIYTALDKLGLDIPPYWLQH